jgi:selenocysteine-specific elongation factor
MVVAAADAIAKSRFINAEVHIARNAEGPIRTRTRLRLYIGTAAVNTLMVIMSREQLMPGEAGLVQFRLSEPLGCVPGDGFVLSLLNKNWGMAGGRVLEITDEKYRQAKDPWIRPRLQAVGKGNISGYLDSVYDRYPHRAVRAKDLEGRTLFSAPDLAADIHRRLRHGEAVHIENAGTLKKTHYDQIDAADHRNNRMPACPKNIENSVFY